MTVISKSSDIQIKNVCDRSGRVHLPFLYVRNLSKPNQPTDFSFPIRIQNGKGRSFQSSWFKTFDWLRYDEEKDAAFCFTCLKAVETKSLSTKSLSQSDAFTKSGFGNWKNALTKGDSNMKGAKGLYMHNESQSPVEAHLRYITANTTAIGDVNEMNSSTLVEQRRENWKMLLKILSNVRYLARQSLVFRGDWNKETGNEENSNFNQLLMQRAEEDMSLIDWLDGNKGNKFTSSTIQNEMIEALGITRFPKIFKMRSISRLWLMKLQMLLTWNRLLYV